jgi:DNA-binding NarL/FixJ family response regulator
MRESLDVEEPRRLLIVDDEPVFRMGLRAVLASYKHQIEIVAEAATADEAIRQAAVLVPDLVLMDLRIPKDRSAPSDLHWKYGVHAIGECIRVVPRCSILVLSNHEEAEVLLWALKAGAHGYVAKGDHYAGKDLVEALLRISAGEAIYGPAVAERIRHIQIHGERATTLVEQLTPREREVLDLMAVRKTNLEIAEALVISVKTVKSHVANILAKLQIESRHEVAHILSTTLLQR